MKLCSEEKGVLSLLWNRRGPERSSAPSTRCIEVRTGSGSSDDQTWMNLDFCHKILAKFANTANFKITKLTVGLPIQKSMSKLLRKRLSLNPFLL